MKSTGFTVLTVGIIIILVGGGYVALRSFQDPVSYVSSTHETIGDLQRIATDPETSENEHEEPPVITTKPPEVAPVVSVPASDNSLEGALQKLLDEETVLKVGSRGPAVGTIQEFLNIYLKKTSKVDNDFGKTTEANIKAFQKANSITQTGQVGPLTLKAMIAWLEKNPQ